jgi:glc operon protein GlcG
MPVQQTRCVLTVVDLETVLRAAREEAARNGWLVTIAIVDEGGHPLALQRLDGAAPVSAYIAGEKARTAALARRESKWYEESINGGRAALLSLGALTGMLEGGLPIMTGGHCIGAVGVSGVKPDQDAQVARAGIAALAI